MQNLKYLFLIILTIIIAYTVSGKHNKLDARINKTIKQTLDTRQKKDSAMHYVRHLFGVK